MPIGPRTKTRGPIFRTPLPFGSGGATFGPFSVVNPDASPEEIEHELRHSEQFSVPGWTLLKVLEQLYPADKGPLEQDAYRRATPTSDIVTSPDKTGLVNRLAQRYIQWSLGDGR